MAQLRNLLKRERVKQGLTQQMLAAKAGVSIACVYQIEQGQRHHVLWSTVVALARGLGVSVSYFDQ